MKLPNIALLAEGDSARLHRTINILLLAEDGRTIEPPLWKATQSSFLIQCRQQGSINKPAY